MTRVVSSAIAIAGFLAAMFLGYGAIKSQVRSQIMEEQENANKKALKDAKQHSDYLNDISDDSYVASLFSEAEPATEVGEADYTESPDPAAEDAIFDWCEAHTGSSDEELLCISELGGFEAKFYKYQE